MREHSGHKNSNTNRDPTLRDAEKKKRVSGEAELDSGASDKKQRALAPGD
jgi:hypothetical protein